MKYYADFPQRTQDLDQAKFLLKEGRCSTWNVTLHTSSIAGMLEAATLYAEQAKGAVNVVNEPEDTYFTSLYLKLNFAQTLWNPLPMSNFFDTALRSTGAFNETHWKSAKFDAMLSAAEGELDETKATDLWRQTQQVLFDEGGYLVWDFNPGSTEFPRRCRVPKATASGRSATTTSREWWLA